MARYRVFEKNPITNEWIDREWVEGPSQESAIRQVVKNSEGTFFATPETSFHPVRIEKVEVVRYASKFVADEADLESIPTAGEDES